METPPPHPTAPTGPKWPIVIGILSLVFGTGAFLQQAFAALGIFIVRNQMQQFANQGADQAKIDEYLVMYKSFAIQSSITLSLVALLLVLSGILLLKRRRITAILHQVWAVLKILAGGYFLFKSQSMTRLQMSIMLDSPSMGAGKSGAQAAEMVGNITSAAMWVGAAFGFVFLALYPIFLIVWFNRAKVRTTLEQW